MPIGKDRDTQEILMSEGFIQQNVELQLIRCLTPNARLQRWMKEALEREAAALARPLKELQFSVTAAEAEPVHEEAAAFTTTPGA